MSILFEKEAKRKIKMVVHKVVRTAYAKRQQTLSYADYYKRYGTTEPRDGWQMANPTGNKVIYVR